MACFHPLTAYRGRGGRIVFDSSQRIGPEMQLPCGQCIGCRLERSRQWAVRMMHEAQLHEDNCFITLTYSPENLPRDGSLNKAHFQGFMKRLRARFSGRKIRFFHCGEYGEQLQRPHYHACLFGFDFPDKVFYKHVGDSRLYLSQILEDTWRFGFCSIGEVTFESAAYVARYITKKVTGDLADDHYLSFDPVTGESFVLQPEYVTMSRRPGLASAWFEEYCNEVFPSDEVIARGFACRPPRYYDKLFEAAHGDLDFIKRERRKALRAHLDDVSPERLRVRERCAQARLAQGKRSFEGC